jgi:hypothetical protein
MNSDHFRERAGARTRMSDHGEIGHDNDAQQRRSGQGDGLWWGLDLILMPLEVIVLAIRAIGGLIAAIFAST